MLGLKVFVKGRTGLSSSNEAGDLSDGIETAGPLAPHQDDSRQANFPAASGKRCRAGERLKYVIGSDSAQEAEARILAG